LFLKRLRAEINRLADAGKVVGEFSTLEAMQEKIMHTAIH